MTKIIGLTGSIATGKSFVSSIIKNELNYPLIDADKLAREIVEINKPAYLEIVENFGEKILEKSKIHPLGGLGAPLNRKALREIIFNNPEKRKLLNEITHKYIKEEFLRKVEEYKGISPWPDCDSKNTQSDCDSNASPDYKGDTSTTLSDLIIFYDVPLLFEVKIEKQFYKIVLVYTPQEIQIKRLMKRDNISLEEAKKTINSQISIEDKKLKSDFIIDNTREKSENSNEVIKEQILEIIKNIKEGK